MVTDENGNSQDSQNNNDQNVNSALSTPDGTTTLLDTGKPVTVPADGGDGGDGSGAPEVFKPSPVIEYIKSTDTSIKIPDDLNAENQNQFIDTYFKSKYEPVPVPLNPIAAELHQLSLDPNFDFNNWVQSKVGDTGILNMSDDDIIKWDLVKRLGAYDEKENPNGISDDDVADHLSDMGKIQKKNEAIRIRNEIKETQKNATTGITEQNEQYIEQQNELMKKKRSEMLTQLFDQSKKITEIGGLPVSQTQHEAFHPVFKELTAPKGNKPSPINEMLSNNETLYKVAYFLLRENEFKAYMTDLKETVKNEWWEKLGLRPETQDGTEGGTTELTEKDVKQRLSKPDGAV